VALKQCPNCGGKDFDCAAAVQLDVRNSWWRRNWNESFHRLSASLKTAQIDLTFNLKTMSRSSRARKLPFGIAQIG